MLMAFSVLGLDQAARAQTKSELSKAEKAKRRQIRKKRKENQKKEKRREKRKDGGDIHSQKYRDFRGGEYLC